MRLTLGNPPVSWRRCLTSRGSPSSRPSGSRGPRGVSPLRLRSGGRVDAAGRVDPGQIYGVRAQRNVVDWTLTEVAACRSERPTAPQPLRGVADEAGIGHSGVVESPIREGVGESGRERPKTTEHGTGRNRGQYLFAGGALSIADNDQSLLDSSDLIFVHPPDTASVEAPAKSAFYGVDAHAYAFAEFVTGFLSKYAALCGVRLGSGTVSSRGRRR
jgi:hypothetical protein